MHGWNLSRWSLTTLMIAGSLIICQTLFPAEPPKFDVQTELVQPQEGNEKILIELFLAPDQKKNLEIIKNEFITRRSNVPGHRVRQPLLVMMERFIKDGGVCGTPRVRQRRITYTPPVMSYLAINTWKAIQMATR